MKGYPDYFASDIDHALYLIGAQPYSYFQYGWEFTRELENASVWVDTEKRQGKITWK